MSSRVSWSRKAAGMLAAGCAVALAASLAVVVGLERKGAHPSPSPENPSQATPDASPDGFPDVDWTWWESVNPDVIGWITVPGTQVDLPIVQAHADDPQRYLTHDVYGDPNFTGCPYLDAACEAQGGLLECPNSVVFGHNMGWNRDSFGDLAGYASPAFARDRRTVLLQTPQRKMRLEVRAADVIPGWDPAKRIEFSDEADFSRWWKDAWSGSDVRLSEGAGRPARLLTLCTCSYNRWSSEHTLVYCTLGERQD